MNPMYDCSNDTPLENMKTFIESFDRPAILINDKGKVIGKNKLATFKLIPVRMGGYLRDFLPPGELRVLRFMKLGERRWMQLDIGAAIAVRFSGFILITIKRSVQEYKNIVFDISDGVNESLTTVLNYCLGVACEYHEETQKLIKEHMCRQINCNKMLSMVHGTDFHCRKDFNPYNVATVVCDIASKLDGAGDAVIETEVDTCLYVCRGDDEDYCSLLAAMTSFGLRYRRSETVRLIGALKNNKYRFDVCFKSSVPPRDIERLLNDMDGTTFAPLSLRADIMYMRSIADNFFWKFEVQPLQTGEMRLSVYVPVDMPKLLPLGQRRPQTRLRFVAEVQLAPFIIKRYVPKNPFTGE